MTPLELIMGRSSAKRFSSDLPTRAQIEQILHAAVRAPDHGLLTPWRFLVLQGERCELFADALSAALKERNAGVDEEAVQRERSKALRSPVLIVVAATITDHPKVPELEQLLAVGAAIENMILAARSIGLGTMWKTGPAAYNHSIKEILGFTATDHIVGFIHLGRPLEYKPVRDVQIASVTRWL